LKIDDTTTPGNPQHQHPRTTPSADAGRAEESVRLVRELRGRLFRNVLKALWRKPKDEFVIFGRIMLFAAITGMVMIDCPAPILLYGLYLYLFHVFAGFHVLELGKRSRCFTRYRFPDRSLLLLAQLDLRALFLHNIRRNLLTQALLSGASFLFMLPLFYYLNVSLMHIFLFSILLFNVYFLVFSFELMWHAQEQEGTGKRWYMNPILLLFSLLFALFFLLPAIPLFVLFHPGRYIYPALGLGLALLTVLSFVYWKKNILPGGGDHQVWVRCFEQEERRFVFSLVSSLAEPSHDEASRTRERKQRKRWWERGVLDPGYYRMREEGTGWEAVGEVFIVNLKQRIVFRLLVPLLILILSAVTAAVWGASIGAGVFLLGVILFELILCVSYPDIASSHPSLSSFLNSRKVYTSYVSEFFYLLPFRGKEVIRKIFVLHLSLLLVGLLVILMEVVLNAILFGSPDFITMQGMFFFSVALAVLLCSFSAFLVYFHFRFRSSFFAQSSIINLVHLSVLVLAVILFLFYIRFCMYVLVGAVFLWFSLAYYIFMVLFFSGLGILFYRESIKIYNTMSISR